MGVLSARRSYADGGGAVKLDLTDPMVRDMADRDHVPEERWTRGGLGQRVLESVDCTECGETWPCYTRVQLRQLEAKQ